jgi:hypothetical protein
VRAGIALALVVAGAALAQPARTGRGPLEPTGPVPPDTVITANRDSLTADTARVAPEPKPPARPAPFPRKSPGRAVLLSALLPGGGQVYNGDWWKTLVIAPAELGLAFFAVRDHASATAALRGGDEDEYVRLRDRRNALLWWTGAVTAFSMADAYVSAQMYAFDRQMTFALGPNRAGIRLEL